MPKVKGVPTTQNTMSQIRDRYSSQTLTKRDNNDSQKNSKHADINDKHNASKLNHHSDESDYEDNIPLKIVQEGLNAMSGESPICGRTRIRKCHDLTSRYN